MATSAHNSSIASTTWAGATEGIPGRKHEEPGNPLAGPDGRHDDGTESLVAEVSEGPERRSEHRADGVGGCDAAN